MQIRRTTTVQNTNAINLKTQNKTSGVSVESNSIPVDQLDISPEALAIQNNAGIRTEKVAEIRQEIAAGRYETAEKLDQAVERLLDEIA